MLSKATVLFPLGINEVSYCSPCSETLGGNSILGFGFYNGLTYLIIILILISNDTWYFFHDYLFTFYILLQFINLKFNFFYFPLGINVFNIFYYFRSQPIIEWDQGRNWSRNYRETLHTGSLSSVYSFTLLIQPILTSLYVVPTLKCIDH